MNVEHYLAGARDARLSVHAFLAFAGEVSAPEMNVCAFPGQSQGPCSWHVGTCLLSPGLCSCSEQPATQKRGPLGSNWAPPHPAPPTNYRLFCASGNRQT